MSVVTSNGHKTGCSWSFYREVVKRARGSSAVSRRGLSSAAKWVIYIDFDEVLPAEGPATDDGEVYA